MARKKAAAAAAEPDDGDDQQHHHPLLNHQNGDADADGDPSDHAFEYEFGGPVGATLTMILLPVIVVLLAYWSDQGTIDLSPILDLNYDDIVLSFHNKQHDSYSTFAVVPFLNQIRAMIHIVVEIMYNITTQLCPQCVNLSAMLQWTGVVLGWFLWQVICERLLPAEHVEGVVLENGQRLTYRINGHLAFWVTLLVVLNIGYPVYDDTTSEPKWQLSGSFPLHHIYDAYIPCAICTIVACFLLSVYMYLRSFREGGGKGSDDEDSDIDMDDTNDIILAEGGDSGNLFYDFWMGRELNPRFRHTTFDWKEFCELRPGLIGWLLLDVACAQQQYLYQGYISGSMCLLLAFQGFYVWDALYQERAILTTMDITTDGFGFMLIFGDLAWVPFTYSIQARYLVKHDPHLSLVQLAGVLCVHCFGYYIFRSANNQKDLFRQDPDHPAVQHLEWMDTKRGTKLLTSGWWGRARKINYTGDWIMGLAWCLLCGFDSVVPYYYAIYFAILLVHRSIRDDLLCQRKYGDDWDRYKEIVPCRFIPGVV